MIGFRQEGNTLIWEMNHETLYIEPWGPQQPAACGLPRGRTSSTMCLRRCWRRRRRCRDRDWRKSDYSQRRYVG